MMYRTSSLSLFLLLLTMSAFAADPEPRFGIVADLKAYPQNTPQETLASVLKAVADKRVDYLLAHLADPDYVDGRLKRLDDGDFKRAVDDARARLDAATVAQLQRFSKEGKWTINVDKANVNLADIKDRVVYFRKVDGRWRLEHRNKPE